MGKEPSQACVSCAPEVANGDGVGAAQLLHGYHSAVPARSVHRAELALADLRAPDQAPARCLSGLPMHTTIRARMQHQCPSFGGAPWGASHLHAEHDLQSDGHAQRCFGESRPAMQAFKRYVCKYFEAVRCSGQARRVPSPRSAGPWGRSPTPAAAPRQHRPRCGSTWQHGRHRRSVTKMASHRHIRPNLWHVCCSCAFQHALRLRPAPAGEDSPGYSLAFLLHAGLGTIQKGKGSLARGTGSAPR